MRACRGTNTVVLVANLARRIDRGRTDRDGRADRGVDRAGLDPELDDRGRRDMRGELQVLVVGAEMDRGVAFERDVQACR